MLEVFIQKHHKVLVALRNTCRPPTPEQVSFLKNAVMCSPRKARGMRFY